MPNIKSAERRMRSNARKHARNKAVKSRLKTLERRVNEAVAIGDASKASQALKDVTSALDKASKKGVLHRSTVDRKKSRIALRVAGASK